jgi:hypothetical protein
MKTKTDGRYQEFLTRAQLTDVLGYRMYVASLEDILQGKVRAYADQTRRRSRRQKDLADILTITGAYPESRTRLPPALQREVEEEEP